MFPVGEFNNFVMYGVATIAATVGIACGRRLASPTQSPNTDAVNEAGHANETPLLSEKDTAVAPTEEPISDVKEPVIDAPVHQAGLAGPITADNTRPTTATITQAPSTNHPIEPQPTQLIHPTAVVVALPPKRASLKRKSLHDQSDDDNLSYGYPYNLESIYPPLKRSRTPSSDTEEKAKEDAGRSNPQSRAPSPPVVQPLPEAQHTQESPLESATVATSNTIIPSSNLEQASAIEQDTQEATQDANISALPEPPKTPPPFKSSTGFGFSSFGGASPFATIAKTSSSSTLHGSSFASYQSQGSFSSTSFPKTPSRVLGSGGFASFAGTASPFANASTQSPNARASIWASAHNSQEDINSVPLQGTQDAAAEDQRGRGRAKRVRVRQESHEDEDKDGSQARAVSQSQPQSPAREAESSTQVENPVKVKAKKSKANNDDGHAITAATCTNDDLAKAPIQRVTGEEDEDVETELKSIKLFVNRGNKGFSGGVLGNLKVLSDRKTLGRRMLFRREPLWQVSMNIRIQTVMRCSYESEENTLRVIVRELVEKKDVPREQWKDELVVYALKPGRNASKKDFKEFAESLVESVKSKAQA
ncbi:hypothetical protein AX16_009253 [Volvariella volvacea WC 439]|nr:hypothetical protein AX16_009253 [Volvariella volvacea WC 439]